MPLERKLGIAIRDLPLYGQLSHVREKWHAAALDYLKIKKEGLESMKASTMRWLGAAMSQNFSCILRVYRQMRSDLSMAFIRESVAFTHVRELHSPMAFRVAMMIPANVC